MTVENANYISELNPNWPEGTDFLYEGDDQIRVTKKATQQSFPNINGEVVCAPADLNQLTGVKVWSTGDVKMGVSVLADPGWLLMDGSPIPILPENAALIALVGDNTPNFQGAFVRGWSTDALVDPDGPRAPLTAQAEEIGPHIHTTPVWSTDSASSPAAKSGGGSQTNTAVTQTMTTTENRPANIALAYFIKT